MRQLNVSFDPMQDRLLLKMTAGAEPPVEFRLWLTRRLTRLLWRALEHYLRNTVGRDPRISADNRDAIIHFQQQDALARSDFKTPYMPPADAAPVFGAEPLLVSRIQIQQTPEGADALALHDEGGRGARLSLSAQLAHSLEKLVAEGAARAEWDLGLMPARGGLAGAAEADKTGMVN